MKRHECIVNALCHPEGSGSDPTDPGVGEARVACPRQPLRIVIPKRTREGSRGGDTRSLPEIPRSLRLPRNDTV